MQTDFAPLMLPLSSVEEGLENSYKVFSTNGETVIVEASSAAEAIEKSGIKRPLRIISIRQEQQRMMSRNVLHPQERTVSTNIDTEHYVPDFRSLVVDDLEEEEKPPFEECSLSSLAVRTLDKMPEKPKPAPRVRPQPVVDNSPPPVPQPIEEEVALIAVEKQIEPAVPEQEVLPPDHELTMEEVEALMKAQPLE